MRKNASLILRGKIEVDFDFQSKAMVVYFFFLDAVKLEIMNIITSIIDLQKFQWLIIANTQLKRNILIGDWGVILSSLTF